MPRLRFAIFALVLGTGTLGAFATTSQNQYPPPCVEINSDHPLLIFSCPEPANGDPAAYAETVIGAWKSAPDNLRPYTTLQVAVNAADPATRFEKLRALLTELQEAEVPTVVRVYDGNPQHLEPLDQVKSLLRGFTCVKGVQALGLRFNEYYSFGDDDPLGEPPNVRWLSGLIDLAAQYGRFTAIQLGRLNWPRVMSNAWCKPLYEKIRACRSYVLPIAQAAGQHAIPNISAAFGLWLEGAAAQWGVSAGSHWYANAHFIKPGEFGASDPPPAMPPAFYRAQILNGLMTGASVYSFDSGAQLWFGPAHHYWDTAIYPLLTNIIQNHYIPRKNFITKEQVHVAYQLAPAHTSADFHLNLRDIDGVFDKGFLIRGAYGIKRPGQVPEFIPNNGRYFWIPLLSPYAPQNVLASFSRVVQAGTMTSPQQWTRLLNRYYDPKASGTAYVSVGRAIVVMQSHENLYGEQTYHINSVPAAVRGIQAKFEGSQVLVTWPFREGDIAYNVYRRVLPETRFSMVAHDLNQRQWIDKGVAPTDTVAYSVTALTTEHEPLDGTVNYGDYLLFSAVQSRIAEEVTVGPLSQSAISKPIPQPVDTRPKTQQWWPNYAGLTDKQKRVAAAVVARIEAWDKAFSTKNLDGVMDLYSTDYEDPQGWHFEYVARAYKWFFQRYSACKMQRQIRQWNFKNFETSRQVEVLLYCRFTGVAITDPSGRFADTVAYFPRTAGSEVWVTFADPLGVCRIVRTNPALPNFNDILSFSAGPDDGFQLGPDLRRGKP